MDICTLNNRFRSKQKAISNGISQCACSHSKTYGRIQNKNSIAFNFIMMFEKGNGHIKLCSKF